MQIHEEFCGILAICGNYNYLALLVRLFCDRVKGSEWHASFIGGEDIYLLLLFADETFWITVLELNFRVLCIIPMLDHGYSPDFGSLNKQRISALKKQNPFSRTPLEVWKESKAKPVVFFFLFL